MKSLRLFSIAVLLSAGFTPRVPKSVVIATRNAESFVAEILFVRDSVVVLTKSPGASEDDLISRDDAMMSIPDTDIVSVQIRGESHSVTGGAIGMLVGGTAGAAIGASTGDKQVAGNSSVWNMDFGGVRNVLGGGFIGCMSGCFVGALIGDDIRTCADIVTPARRDFKALSRFQRYYAEPEFMKQRAR